MINRFVFQFLVRVFQVCIQKTLNNPVRYFVLDKIFHENACFIGTENKHPVLDVFPCMEKIQDILEDNPVNNHTTKQNEKIYQDDSKINLYLTVK